MAMLTALSAAALLQAASAPDLSWLAGYWLDCSGGREASETWSDPRQGLLVGHTVTVRNGRSGFEFARIGAMPDGVLAYMAQPGGGAPTPFRLIVKRAAAGGLRQPRQRLSAPHPLFTRGGCADRPYRRGG